MKVFAILSIIAAIASPIAAQTLCTTNTLGSPLSTDCQAAIAKLPKPPANGQPLPCILIYAPRWTLAESGSCRIQGYSSGGGAACLDRAKVIQAAKKIQSTCVVGERVEGGSAITQSKGIFEGVQFVVSPAGAPLEKREQAFKA